MGIEAAVLQKLVDENLVGDIWFSFEQIEDKYGWKLNIRYHSGEQSFLIGKSDNIRLFSNESTAVRFIGRMGWRESRFDMSSWEDGKLYNAHKTQANRLRKKNQENSKTE